MKSGEHLRSWGLALALVLAGLFLGGCRTSDPAEAAFHDSVGGPAGSAAVLAENPALTGIGQAEVLNVGDTLSIVYNDLPILQPAWEGQIKADGTITLLLNQTFQAAGKTRSQLEKDIRDRYVPNYFRNMTVTIKQREETRLYYVGGQVRAPGRQVYLTRTSVLKAIQSAGDFNDWANRKKVRLTRADGKRTQVIDVSKIIRGAAPDVEVYPGDSIYVPKKLW